MLFPLLWFGGSALLLRAVTRRCYLGEVGKTLVIAIKDKSGVALITELTLSAPCRCISTSSSTENNLSPDLLEEPFCWRKPEPQPPSHVRCSGSTVPSWFRQTFR